MDRKRSPGQVEISFTYSRHSGPVFIHGSVTLQFDSLKNYSFISQAQWPIVDNYDVFIREAVEEVLRERQGHLDTTLVLLKKIEWDDIASCALGFRRAAAAATRAAFEV